MRRPIAASTTLATILIGAPIFCGEWNARAGRGTRALAKTLADSGAVSCSGAMNWKERQSC
eukprot:8071750-Lingulodinium_polyedra.AAC.1